MSDTLGKTLAATRVKKGLSVEEVSSITRVNAKFIRLIEEDKYDQLPGEVFIRGLLRSYAGVVGLSGDEVMARYNALGVSIKDRSPELISLPLHPKPRWIKKLLTALLSFTAIVGIIYYYLAPLEPSPEKPFSPVMEGISPTAKMRGGAIAEPDKTSIAPDTSPAETPEIQTEPKPEVKPEPKEKTEQMQPAPSPVTPPRQPIVDEPKKTEQKPVESPARQSAQATSAEKGRHKLTVTASDVSWISVTIDGSVTRQVFLNAGETAAWVGEKRFRITIGNAAATKVYLDGVELKLKNVVQNVVKEMDIPANKVEKPEGLEG